MLETTKDEELMMSYRDGNAAAFDVLYARHKGSVYRYVLRQCGQTHADELFQEIWLKLINARNKYEVKASFKTWLYKLAHNHIIDHYRRLNVRPVNNNSSSDSIENELPDNKQSTPEQNAQTNEQHSLLLKIIHTLPADQRDTLLLKEEAGLSLAEIAESTGVNIETAKSRLRYAINKIKTEMNHLYEDSP